MPLRSVLQSVLALRRAAQAIRRHPVPLLAVVSLAIALREIPAWTNGAWGNDFGIYLGLTEGMLRTGELFPAYDGWGTSYQYFPVLYVLSALVHLATGADLVWLMPRLAGVLGGLTVLFLYGIGMEVSRSRRLALLAALILAVDPIHVYETSHAAPLTVGHLALAAGLFCFLRWRKGASLWPLAVAAGLLILSHHLSTYMFILAIAGMSYGGRILGSSSDKEFRRDVGFLVSFCAVAFAYWALVASPVMTHVRFVSGLALPVAGAIVLSVLIASAWLVPRWADRIRGSFHRALVARRPRSVFLLAFALCYGFVAVNVFLRPFGDVFGLEAKALIVLLPPFLLLSIAASGVVRSVQEPRWAPVHDLLLALVGSLVFGFLVQSPVIIPYRHLEYLSIPIALLAARAILSWRFRTSPVSAPIDHGSRSRLGVPFRTAAAAAIPLLLLANAVSGLAAVNGHLGFDERIPDVSLDAVAWMKGHLGPGGTVAADHRMSQVLWARGFRVTSDGARAVWLDESWRDIVPELCGFHPRVDYVFVDHIMTESGIQSGTNATPPKMTAASYAKFHLRSGPFDLLHREESMDGERWAEVYRVDWEQIARDRFLPWQHPSC